VVTSLCCFDSASTVGGVKVGCAIDWSILPEEQPDRPLALPEDKRQLCGPINMMGLRCQRCVERTFDCALHGNFARERLTRSKARRLIVIA
jgi:hypothetical protein